MPIGDFGSVVADQVLVASIFTFGSSSSAQPTISFVRGDVFCAVYTAASAGPNFSVELRTFTISSTGTVSAVIGSATVLASVSDRSHATVARYADGIVTILVSDGGPPAYRLYTYEIDSAGTIVGQVDTQVLTGTVIRQPRAQVRRVSATVLAAAYVDDTLLRVSTVSIDSAGNLGAELATQTFGTASAFAMDRVTDLVNVRGNIWAAGRATGTGDTGTVFVNTFTINPSSGAITSNDSDQFSADAFHPSTLVALDPDDDGMLAILGIRQFASDIDQLQLNSETVDSGGTLSGVLDMETLASHGAQTYSPALSLGGRALLLNEDNLSPTSQRTYTVDGAGTFASVGTSSGVSFSVACHYAYVPGTGSPGVVSTSLVAMVGMLGSDLRIAVFEVEASLEAAAQAGTLCVTYTPFFGGAATELCFDLKINSWREVIQSQAQVLPTAGITGVAITINAIQFIITLGGTIYAAHPVHPLAVGVNHNPDRIDLEEMAILWNRDGLTSKVRLTLALPSGDREYRGVIKAVQLKQQGGEFSVWRFTMTFQVLWTPSFPQWRGWT